MSSPQQAEIHRSKGAEFCFGIRVYKLVVLGQSGVGKSALKRLFVSGTFQDDYPDFTIEDESLRQTVVDTRVCMLQILDTDGQEMFVMRERYMRGGEGFLLVYAVTDKRSFEEVRKFKEMIDQARNHEPVPIVIVGNKSDLEAKRQISKAEGDAMAKEFGCPFYETSAALRHNVDEVYHDIVRCIRKKENDAENPATKRSSKSTGRSSFLCCFSGET